MSFSDLPKRALDVPRMKEVLSPMLGFKHGSEEFKVFEANLKRCQAAFRASSGELGPDLDKWSRDKKDAFRLATWLSEAYGSHIWPDRPDQPDGRESGIPRPEYSKDKVL
jgi:hypothetical protein